MIGKIVRRMRAWHLRRQRTLARERQLVAVATVMTAALRDVPLTTSHPGGAGGFLADMMRADADA
ncbi:hypothetical protein [Rhodobium gokarnense]|uniref:Uncharacterized protein n=1 Tax=Rhodobium gokarnense TaxID=364296 RepID=A0ABT3HHC9_9HYPH|nr:hypothetical protein [Rhodobium gokarnense]MCW2309709.1 hypothetical protein [Rhodobium gokarnense]